MNIRDEAGNGEGIPTLEEIIDYYRSRNLLAHEGAVMNIAQKIKTLPVSVPFEEIQKFTALLTIWPLIEIYRLHQKSVTSDLNGNERERLEQLAAKYNSLSQGDDRNQVIDYLLSDKKFPVQFLNPYALSANYILKRVLSVKCDPLEGHLKGTKMSRMKIVHDTEMGGTLYVLGKPKEDGLSEAVQQIRIDNAALYSFMQRSFICVNKENELVMFMDNMEGGFPFFKDLDHWRGYGEDGRLSSDAVNRIHEVYCAVAAIMYLAERLGIRYVIPRDFELVQLSRQLGLPERKVFSKEQGHWKIGLHSQKRYTGVYVHSLYRGNKNRDGHQLRHPVLDMFPYTAPQEMLDQLRDISIYIIGSNENRRILFPKTKERIATLRALNNLIQDHPLTTPYARTKAQEIVTDIQEKYKS